MPDSTPSLLTTYDLTTAQAGALPPELRDQLLDFIELWGTPTETLSLLAVYWELHGPLLAFLDREAEAHFSLGELPKALEAIERRQRRSTTIASQALESRVTLAAGHSAAAKAVADDISQAHPLHSVAVNAAAAVYAELGEPERARELLDVLLAARPSDIDSLITSAHIALAQNDPSTRFRQAQPTGSGDVLSLSKGHRWATAQEMAARLGAGIPSGTTVPQLRALQKLHEVLGNQQSANAVALEIERQHLIHQEALQTALAPIIGLVQKGGDLGQVYAALSGPERIPVSSSEARQVKLAAIRNFGFGTLRPGQPEIIASVLRGESVLAVMPTGAGKSLCYQLPGLELEHATLVISPLIALMKDQVEGLPALAQSKATFINSSLDDDELKQRMEGVAAGRYKLVYAAPERLRQRPFLRALRDAGLSLFVVDEAHCVSLWGHDFRPDYLFIQEARAELGDPPALAMTATAPPQVRDEILDTLSRNGDAALPHPERPQVVALDIFRTNLHLSAIQFHNDEEKLAALIKFVTETEGSGIVYTNSRRKCESLALRLRSEGVAAEAYHAGLSDRGGVQDRFMKGQSRVVVATVAFGMGIDKADIRFIVHFHPPRSLAAYYQEAGRAGRDGLPAQCTLFYSANDWSNLRRWAKADEYSLESLERLYAAIASQLGVETEEGTEPAAASGPVNIHRLEQVLNADETEVRVGVSILERAGLLSRGFDLPSEIEIGLPSRATAGRVSGDQRELERFLRKVSLRPGRSAAFTAKDIASAMDWPLLTVEARLLEWHSAGVISLLGSKREMAIHLPPRPADLAERLERLLAQSRALGQRRIDDIVGYATGESCRHGFISAHFGSPPRIRCTICDNCTGIRPQVPEVVRPDIPLPDDADIEPMLLDCLISLPKPVGRSGLARILVGHLRAPVAANECRHHGRLYEMGESAIVEMLDELIERKLLRQYERQGYPVLAVTMAGRVVGEDWLAAHPEMVDPTAEAPAVVEGEIAEEEEVAAETYTALQKALYGWRRRTADGQGIPTYAIMDNELMLRIAESRPQHMEELAQLPGMGAARLEKYGGVILDLVKLTASSGDDEAMLIAQRENPHPHLTSSFDRLRTPPAAREGLPVKKVDPRVERQLYMKMQELRQKVAVTERGKSYLIAGNGLLKEIAKTAPRSAEELNAIIGFRSSGLAGKEAEIVGMVEEVLRR
ncbi:MAG: RecQ family ATP-dependent DNA helicase, partial [Chloroflexi bacterium]|nr:RecQ family ATP-dependent DNA helicase [Chloroflexota bacterium]